MYDINNLYNYKDIDFINELLERLIKKLNLENAIFSIILVDDEIMKDLNKTYRNIDSTTDVLSFAFEDNKDIEYNDFRVLGDIYISIPKMIKQAIEYKFSEKRELSFLIIHGLLHLLGYNHESIEEEKVMFTLQEALLNDTK